MAEKKNPLVFMDVSVKKVHVGKIIFELFPDIAPATVENFRALCTGERGVGKILGLPLRYKGSFFYNNWKGYSFVKGGDLHSSRGLCGESIWGERFPCEMPQLPHNERGLLSMNICDRYGLGSHFIITVRPDQSLDRFHVVFGKIVKGLETLDKITEAWADVIVSDCGEYEPDETKAETRAVCLDGVNPVSEELKKLKEENVEFRRRLKFGEQVLYFLAALNLYLIWKVIVVNFSVH